VDRVHLREPALRGRRLVVRLALFAFCGGLLLLLSSRPAEAAERREPGLLDPVRTTLKATAREVDSFAGRATGSGASTAGSAVRRGAPAVTSPVRRAARPTRPAAAPVRAATRSTGAAEPLTGALTGALSGPLESAGKLTAKPVAKITAPVVAPVSSALAPVGSVLDPVGAALAPVGSALAPVTGPVVPGGLPLLPQPTGTGAGSPAGAQPAAPAAARTGPDGTGAAPAPIVSRTPARPVADGSSSPAARSTRSWPALTGAVSLPGFPASAELPAGGPDPLSTSSGGAFTALAALAAALLLLGPLGRGRTRPDRSGVLSRSYLPLVSPA